jgi:hypothetical protein
MLWDSSCQDRGYYHLLQFYMASAYGFSIYSVVQNAFSTLIDLAEPVSLQLTFCLEKASLARRLGCD